MNHAHLCSSLNLCGGSSFCETLYSKFKCLGLQKFDRSWSWSLMKRFKETKVRMLPGLRLVRIRRYQSWSLSAEIFSVMHVQKDNRRKCSLLVLVKVLPRSNDRFSQFPDIQTCLRIPKGKKKKKKEKYPILSPRLRSFNQYPRATGSRLLAPVRWSVGTF